MYHSTFLLPPNKTLAILGEAKGATDSMSLPSSLPEPEVYVIVNGKPTKGGVLWWNLVNVDSVKRALATLKQINWLYTDVADDCVDEVVQKVIEVSNNATTAVLEKASETDIAAFQQFTIRNLDTKLVCESDLEQYKMLSVTNAEYIKSRLLNPFQYVFYLLSQKEKREISAGVEHTCTDLAHAQVYEAATHVCWHAVARGEWF